MNFGESREKEMTNPYDRQRYKEHSGTNRRENFSMAIEFLHCLKVFQWIKTKRNGFYV